MNIIDIKEQTTNPLNTLPFSTDPILSLAQRTGKAGLAVLATVSPIPYALNTLYRNGHSIVQNTLKLNPKNSGIKNSHVVALIASDVLTIANALFRLSPIYQMLKTTTATYKLAYNLREAFKDQATSRRFTYIAGTIFAGAAAGILISSGGIHLVAVMKVVKVGAVVLSIKKAKSELNKENYIESAEAASITGIRFFQTITALL